MKMRKYLLMASILTLFISGYQAVIAAEKHMNSAQSHDVAMTNVTELMRDIGDHMVVISGDLDYGTLNLKQQKTIAAHVRNMALMVVELSGLTDKGINDTNTANIKKMRQQMDNMMKEVSVGTMKPW